jgi:amino acid adenylation domain-containing protein
MTHTQITGATDLLAELSRQGIRVWVDGAHLRIRAPKGVLTRALREHLSERKAELIKLLRVTESSLAGDASICHQLDLKAQGQDRYEPFPLTDIQKAYYVGRSGDFELGKVSCHTYYEVETDDLDLERFNLAWRQLIERHDMLRSIILPDGRQRILRRVPPYQIEVLDLRGQRAENVTAPLQALRRHMSHQAPPADRWPLFEICATRLDDYHMRLHFSFDLLIMDATSMRMLFQEWRWLYHDPQAQLAPLEFSFRDYVLAEAELRGSSGYRRAKAYWLGRLSIIPPAPELPLAIDPRSLVSTRFTRRSGRLEAPLWQALKERASLYGLTPSVVLLTAYSQIIATWSKSPRFSLNVTLVNRLPLHPQVDRVIGDFTSFIPLAIECSGADSFELQAGSLQGQLCEDMEHRCFSGVQIGRELMRARGERSDFYFPVVFTSLLGQSQRRGDYADKFWMGNVIYGISQTPQVWLDNQVVEEEGALVLYWDAVEDLFPEGLLNEMFDAYIALLHRLGDDDSIWRQPRLCLTPTAQIERRAAINDVTAPTPDVLLHELFFHQSLRRPNQPAVVSADRVLSYQELSERVSSLARKLMKLGARPNQLVAVVMENGWEQVVATLAIMQSGAAYLPISAETPKSRLLDLLEDSQARIVMTQSWSDQKIEWPESIVRIAVDLEDAQTTDESSLLRAQSADDLAYVIYTSGSTGKPKGVMISHRGAVNTILDINRRFDTRPADRALALSSLSFDLSVYDIFGVLAAGATVVIPEPMATRDPALLSKIVRDERVTIWNSVPAQMEMVVSYEESRGGNLPESLRLIMLSGDWIPVNLPERIKRLSEEVKVVSLGGATEASIWSIVHPVETVDPDARSIPYGKPLANQSFHVLDESLNPRPIWAPGQLYIGGIGLAKGYWRDEEKTEVSFIVHPQTGDRLYKTGDWGRYLPSGVIEFLGREDTQVKVRGYRIELGEIEAALARSSKVCAAAIVATDSAHGARRLVAYVVPRADPAPSPDELRDFLKERLPDYMLPSAFVFVDSLPLTPNGKVDRKSLAESSRIHRAGSHRKEWSDSRGETRIERIVAGVLGLEYIKPDQNFLDLGADSLDLVTIVSHLEREIGFRPKIADIYHQPTIIGLLQTYRGMLR